MPALNIVKYANRKLYCKEWRSYTTLQELRAAIKAEFYIQVKHYKTGKDVTSEVFAEVLRLVALQADSEQLASIITHLDQEQA